MNVQDDFLCALSFLTASPSVRFTGPPTQCKILSMVIEVYIRKQSTDYILGKILLSILTIISSILKATLLKLTGVCRIFYFFLVLPLERDT